MAQRKAAPPGRPGSGRSSGTAAKRPATNRPSKPAADPTAPPVSTTKPSTAGTAAPMTSTTKSGATTGTGATKAGATGTAGSSRSGGATRATGRPPTRKPNKSIVNQKQTPWGLIATAVAIVLFAVAIIVVVIATKKSTPSANNGCKSVIGKSKTLYLNELSCAKNIKGVTFKPESGRVHVTTNVTYDSSPPVGGNHNSFWADCTGTVYAQPIANENGVHMLEHGAVWITYNVKTLPASGLATLKQYVSGVDHTALSPYPNLKTPISVQAWGYQLFLTSASDPRIAQFISDLKENPKTTPEQGGACSNPAFKAHPSTFGHPTSA